MPSIDCYIARSASFGSFTVTAAAGGLASTHDLNAFITISRRHMRGDAIGSVYLFTLDPFKNDKGGTAPNTS